MELLNIKSEIVKGWVDENRNNFENHTSSLMDNIELLEPQDSPDPNHNDVIERGISISRKFLSEINSTTKHEAPLKKKRIFHIVPSVPFVLHLSIKKLVFTHKCISTHFVS